MANLLYRCTIMNFLSEYICIDMAPCIDRVAPIKMYLVSKQQISNQIRIQENRFYYTL